MSKTTVLSALTRMTRHGYRRLPVIDPLSEKIIGAVSERSIVNYILDVLPQDVLFGAEKPFGWFHKEGR